MTMRVHKLKTWPEPYAAVSNERKTHELRRADRDFRVGDYLLLLEFVPRTDSLTGQYLHRKISHITVSADMPRGLVDGFVILSLQDCDHFEEEALLGRPSEFNILGKLEWIEPNAT